MKTEKSKKDPKFKKRYILLFLGVGVSFAACVIIVIPCWWIINKFFKWVEYWHVFLFIVFNILFIECYEWRKDYKEKKIDNPWLMIFLFTLFYFIIILICYFTVSRIAGK